MSIKKSILLRVRILFLIVCIFSLCIVYKIVSIQYLSKDVWTKAAEQYSAKIRPVKATRGNIYADSGSLLATSAPKYKVAFDPTRYWSYLHDKLGKKKSKKEIALIYKDSLTVLSKDIALFFDDKNFDEYREKIEKARKAERSYIVINSRMINFHEKKQMEKWTIFNKGRNRGGVIFEKKDNRLIPFNYLARRTIGYSEERVSKKGREFYGAGLEYTFDSLLAGKDGQALFRNIGRSGWWPLHSEHEIKPIHGYDIYTTLNVNLQDQVELSLLRAVQTYEANYGTAIVMEVQTGEIKAIANLTRKERGDKVFYREDYNYAVGDAVEPGSTFKLASMIALFEETSLQLQDTIYTGNGYYDFSNDGTAVMTDSKPGGHQMLTVQEVVEKSSNIGVSKLVHRYFGQNANTSQRYVDYLETMHLTKSLNFQIKGSAAPIVKKVKDWSPTTLPWTSIGYETQMSPLQILTLYAGVANKGVLLRPILVKRVQNSNEVIIENKPDILNPKMCTDSTLEKLQVCLEGVVQRGTAKRTVYTSNYRIAGKTGTAQKLINGKYSKEHHYTSFVGYFPAEAPKYACIVVIDEPHNAEGHTLYGGQAAGPVFREISDYLYQTDLSLHTNLPSDFVIRPGIFPVIQTGFYEDLRGICDTLNIPHNDFLNSSERAKDKWVVADRNDRTKMIDWQNRLIKRGLVPNVKGLTLRDAIYILENLGMKVEAKGHGRVVEQSQTPNSRLLVGTVIKLRLE